MAPPAACRVARSDAPGPQPATSTQSGRTSCQALIPTLWRVLSEMGNPRVFVDPRQRSRAWVEDRRAIDSFFLRDVDRDKIVLYARP
jgi:hypothetical protein